MIDKLRRILRKCAHNANPALLLVFLGMLALLDATPVKAGEKVQVQCVPEGGGTLAQISRLADDIRSGDSFYLKLVTLKGAPTWCPGSVGDSANESWLELSWPDNSRFKTQYMPPETSLVTYERTAGLDEPDEVEASFREYAAYSGLKVDWGAPFRSSEGENTIFEYQDPGVNGIVRLTYDRLHRLVAASLSIAL